VNGGRLDVLVNNAACQQRQKSIERHHRRAVGSDTPMKRPAQPEEIAPAFVFFASNTDSSYIKLET
jgi:NAD(P)-dependent dehydrogenase (short-subunit alcohol dehydrogenase family)